MRIGIIIPTLLLTGAIQAVATEETARMIGTIECIQGRMRLRSGDTTYDLGFRNKAVCEQAYPLVGQQVRVVGVANAQAVGAETPPTFEVARVSPLVVQFTASYQSSAPSNPAAVPLGQIPRDWVERPFSWRIHDANLALRGARDGSIHPLIKIDW